MKTVCFFNNKGGVGKTTLTCNIASKFARNGKRILLVDADPQCNATQLIVGDERTFSMYWPDGTESENVDTLLKVTRLIRAGDSAIDAAVSFIPSSENKFGVTLMPGHPRLSEMEDKLSVAWNNAVGGDVEGLRRTNWAVAFCAAFSADFDYLFFDLGPSLGAINRSVLLAADYFVTPLGSDVFSIVGVRNIAEWLKSWMDLYEDGARICERRNPQSIAEFSLRKSPAIKHGYVGYTLQQYITKSKKGIRRPTQAFDHILSQVPEQITTYLGSFTSPTIGSAGVKLGDVPNMYSLVPLAQSRNCPIGDLKLVVGALVGSQFKQSAEYANILSQFAARLAANMGDSLGANS
jgi:cellulose biosynthesis protein BcsQ